MAPVAHVAVVTPSTTSRPGTDAETTAAAQWAATELGWDVELPVDWWAAHPWGGAGHPARRADALHAALETADAVFCTSGGHHAGDVLDHLTAERIADGSAWFVGTSDNTLLAAVIADNGGTAFCGPDMKLAVPSDHHPTAGVSKPLDFPYTRAAVARLFTNAGQRVHLEVPDGPSGVHRPLRAGDAAGPVVAVNAPCLLKVAGTPWWPHRLLDGAILCIEHPRPDVDSTVAQLVQLHQMGVLDRLAGLVIGWMSGIEGPDGCGGFAAAEAAAVDLTARTGIPVWRSGLFGHRCPHAVIPLGAPGELVDGELHVTWPNR